MIFDKPFNFSEMLRRTIFLGRPNFFNAKDFNKELLIIHSFIEEFNRVFAVHSDVKFNITSFSETLNVGTNMINRQLNLQWDAGTIMYKGVKFPIPSDGIAGYSQMFAPPDETTSPKGIRPNTYIVLTAKLNTITYADNPVLCGIQSDEIISTAPTVDVEQYSDVELKITSDPSVLSNVICVIASIHPRHKENGDNNGTGFMYHTFQNTEFKRANGHDRLPSDFKNNNTLFEYILENVVTKLSLVLNERQLVRRFNLSDIEDFAKARHNLGLSTLVNRRQLVQAENLRDIVDVPMARQNLGLGNSAIRNIGTGSGDVAPGNVLPVGGIMIWSGSASSVPSGWALCDGTLGTPDLKGKFVVGLDSANPDFNLLGKTGAGDGAILVPNNLPKHSHTINDPGHAHSYLEAFQTDSHSSGRHDGSRINKEGRATSTSTTGITIPASGGLDTPEAIKMLPPYYVLCYIMYKGSSALTPPSPLPAEPVLTYPNHSSPSNTTDGGFSTYTVVGIGESGNISVGAGIILTNPE